MLGYLHNMNLSVELEQEEDGRWIADVPALPGVMAYGKTANEALSKAKALALRVLAERLEEGEASAGLSSVTFGMAAS